MLAATDPNAYDPADAAGTIRSLGPWWSMILEGRDPGPARQLVERTVELVAGLAGDPPRGGSPVGELIAWLDRAPARAARRAGDDGAAVADVAASAVAAVLAATADLREQAAGRPASEGVVAHLHRSGGGVPKSAIEQADIGPRGVAGDRQATRRHHGRPWQALCIWSTEVIDALAGAGHPIAPGAAGENITLRGIDWAAVTPGARLRMGEVVAEVAPYAIPCTQNAGWFSDGDFNRIHHRNGPVSRVYALVVEPGRVMAGAAARLEPI
jgi:MOSC domain-containing protein YiiM